LSLFLFVGVPRRRLASSAPLPPYVAAAAAASDSPRYVAASLFHLEFFLSRLILFHPEFFLSRLVLFHLELKLRFFPSGGGDAAALLDLQLW
jgi:hypothetical protein